MLVLMIVGLTVNRSTGQGHNMILQYLSPCKEECTCYVK